MPYLAPLGHTHLPSRFAMRRRAADALAREASAHNAGWRSWFSANEIEPLAVWFEELVADPVGVTRDVLRHLGVDSQRVPVRELTVSSHDRRDNW